MKQTSHDIFGWFQAFNTRPKTRKMIKLFTVYCREGQPHKQSCSVNVSVVMGQY